MDFQEKIAAIADYWNEASEGFDEQHATEDLALWSAELEKAIGLQGRGGVLDVGTGTGFLALLLAKLGYDVSGVDVAEKMLQIGVEKAGHLNLSVDFQKGECEHLQFSDNCFDAVVNCRVMWTLTDPEAAVREWTRVLKSGGRVISFMRMMNVGETGTHGEMNSNGGYYGNGVELPLRCGKREDYIAVYRTAGLDEITVTELPPEMSHAEDMPGWTMFIGMKK